MANNKFGHYPESLGDIHALWLQYHAKYGHRLNDMRFGQFVCNRCLLAGQTFPELYYQRDNKVAYTILVEYLDDCGELR